MEDKIDFVVTWVDGNDIEWQKERNKYAGKDPEDLADYRFRDWDLLRYWFRGVEKFAPWVSKVYFVTNGQKPDWLNVNCEKLVWVKHEDYIPQEYLPTFNSHTIEHNLHRIKELSDKFVYFCDDMFIINEMKKNDFYEENTPRLRACFDAIAIPNETYEHIVLNDVQLINRHCKDCKDIVKGNYFKWVNIYNDKFTNLRNFLFSHYWRVPGFEIPHVARPILKSVIEELWTLEEEKLNETCISKFRDKNQVSSNIYVWYNLIKGRFIPEKKSVGTYYDLSNDNSKSIARDIISDKYKLICINDSSDINDFEKVKKELIDAFEIKFPEKSSFEL